MVLNTSVRVIVVGCGRVGAELASALDRAGHQVAIVDKRPESFRRLQSGFGGTIVTGYGFDRDHLRLAGAEGADALAAVTSGDNSNILTARIGRELFAIPKVVARIYDPRRAMIYQRLGIPTIATVSWATDRALAYLDPTKAGTEWTESTGQVVMVERHLPPGLCGQRLSALEQPGRWHVVAVARAGTVVLGAGDLIGQEGDLVHLAVQARELEQLDEQLAAAADNEGAAR
jgi:trk system potassium uptake protein TrkA